jgi:hypothetical protein
MPLILLFTASSHSPVIFSHFLKIKILNGLGTCTSFFLSLADMSEAEKVQAVEGAAEEQVKVEAGAGDEVKAEPAEVDQQLKKQIEFYFSDSNLPKDKFLLQLTKKTPEGWVSLKTISEFKKMRDMGATVRASVLVRISVSRFENLFIKLVSRTYYQPAGGETCRRRQSI